MDRPVRPFRRGFAAAHRPVLSWLALFAFATLSACAAYDRDRYLALVDGADIESSVASDATDRTDIGNVPDADAASIDVLDATVDSGDVPTPDDGSDVVTDGGACGTCAPGRSCCGSVCVSLDSDPRNCGACNTICAHTTCAAGSCTNTCVFGYQDCNGNIIDGCEASLADDAMNCGRCGNACTGAHATESCTAGSCAITSCATGYADCDGNAMNGCEVDLANDPANCGACATACPTATNATPSCSAMACGITCAPGFADCDGSGANGCEANLGDAANCGACSTACTGTTPICSSSGGSYSCTNGCSSSQTRCGSSCVDAASDANNCGSCGNVCPRPAGGSASCVGGSCRSTCPTGTTQCGSACVDTSTDVTNCGSCSNVCARPASGVPTCTAGVCGSNCNTGFHACGGACVDNTSTATCGSRCSACTPPAMSTATCNGVSCGFTCNTGFHDCGGTCVSSGSVMTCGVSCSPCPIPTNAVATCDGTNCGYRCSSGFHDCGGTCVSNSSVTSCGSTSCTPCTAPANATATCDGTSCGFTCNAGFHLCGGACVSNTSTATCGSSCTPCPAPTNGTAACDGTSCTAMCNTGYHACGSTCASNTSVSTCGTSCTPCSPPSNATATCTSGTCGFNCNTGFHNCSGACVSNSAITSCGSSCTPCTAPSNGTATCSSGTCGFTCNPGFHACGTSCYADNDATHCGASCTACPSDPNGLAACTSGSCTLTCGPGYTNCSGACVRTTTDVMNCGGCGNVCPAPSGGTATCSASTCGGTCPSGCSLTTSFTCTCTIAAPRPIAPLSTSIVTTARPTLRWMLAAGSDGAAITLCRNRAMTLSCLMVNGTGSSLAPTTLAPGTWYWQLRGRLGTMTGTATGPVWQFRVPARSTTVDTSWATLFDPNGDGYGDALIGAPSASSGAGAAHIVYGGATGLTSSTIDNLNPVPGYAGLGVSTASAGDFNGDGFGDAVVGAPNGMTGGAISLFLGAAGGLGASWRAAFTSAVGHGTSISAAGDIDGDGYADFVTGNPSEFSGMGIVWVAFGDPSSSFARARMPINGTSAGASFGASVSAGGDINCDGRPDLVVGEPGFGTNVGRASIYYGTGTGFATVASTLFGVDTGGRFGTTVAIVGDVNGDGCSDVAIGAPAASSNAGRVYVYFGRSSGIASTGTILGPPPGSTSASFGGAIGGGDFNGDGYYDVFIGAPGIGGVAVFLGDPVSFGGGGTASYTITMPSFGMGSSLSPITNLNGDAFDDLLTGAPLGLAGGQVMWSLSSGAGFNALNMVPNVDTAGAAFGRAVAWYVDRRSWWFGG